MFSVNGDFVKKLIVHLLVLTVVLLCSCKTMSEPLSVNEISSQESTVANTTESEIYDAVDSKIESATLQPEPQPSVDMPENIQSGKQIVLSDTLKGERYAQSIENLQAILNSHKYNISLCVYSVDGSKSLAYNTETGIFGACTVKAAYTLYACKQMESGNGNLQTQITYEQQHYEPGTGDMQYSPFGTVFSMETALHKSMSISDNVGYLMSVDYFGRDGYNAYMRELGCNSLQIKPTVWSLRTKADDLVKIWCEIYNYFGTDTEYARFLKSSCTNTAGNYATESLQGVEYSHKQGHNSTGDWLSLSDAGIVWKGDTPYIVAIVTDAPGPNAYSRGEFAKIIDIVHNELF